LHELYLYIPTVWRGADVHVSYIEVLSSTMTPKANDKAKATSAKAKPSVLIELRDGWASKVTSAWGIDVET
jgi:hypothetical protein